MDKENFVPDEGGLFLDYRTSEQATPQYVKWLGSFPKTVKEIFFVGRYPIPGMSVFWVKSTDGTITFYLLIDRDSDVRPVGMTARNYWFSEHYREYKSYKLVGVTSLTELKDRFWEFFAKPAYQIVYPSWWQFWKRPFVITEDGYVACPPKFILNDQGALDLWVFAGEL